MSPLTRPRATDDAGSTLPLTIGYAALALAIILLVTAATSLYLERKRLFTLADGAALAGAESFDLTDVLTRNESLAPQLRRADVAAEVRDYLRVAPADFTGLAVEQATTRDGRSATVTLSARWRPPVVSILVPDGLRIEVTAVARSTFR